MNALLNALSLLGTNIEDPVESTINLDTIIEEQTPWFSLAVNQPRSFEIEMPPDDKTFWKLEANVESLEKRVTQTEVVIRQIEGLMHELKGQISVNIQFELLAKQVDAINNQNLVYQREIGEIAGAIKAISQALERSNDATIRQAAKSININVDAGSQGSTTVGGNTGGHAGHGNAGQVGNAGHVGNGNTGNVG